MSAVANPLISVVVPCRNERAHIDLCIRSILSQVEPTGGFEIIVADGMSTDGTREVLAGLARDDSRLRVIDNPDRITACGMNAGITSARGKYIAIMGAHSRYARDYLVSCLGVLLRTAADNVGGAVFAEGETYVQLAIAAAHHSVFSVGGSRWHAAGYEGPVDTVWGGFYPKEVFNRIGLFDECLVRNQDDELNFRLTRSGGLIWQSPSIRSWYRPRSSLTALFQQYRQYGYWKLFVIRKHGRPASWRHLVPAAFLAILAGSGLLAVFAWVIGLIQGLGGSRLVAGIAADSFAFVALAYLIGLGIASISAGARAGWRLVPLLPLAFACHHLGYGLGFLEALVSLRNAETLPVGRMSQLTR